MTIRCLLIFFIANLFRVALCLTRYTALEGRRERNGERGREGWEEGENGERRERERERGERREGGIGGRERRRRGEGRGRRKEKWNKTAKTHEMFAHRKGGLLLTKVQQ